MRKIKYKLWYEAIDQWYDWDECGAFNLWHILNRNDIDDGQIKAVEWTGRTDTNGKEIYDGDLVEYKGDPGVVVWQDDKWYLKPLKMIMEGVSLGVTNGKDIKIVGTIYKKEEGGDNTGDKKD